MSRPVVRLCLAAMVAVTACSGDGGASPGTTASTESTETLPGTATTAPVAVPDLLAGLDRETVDLAGEDLLVAVAGTPGSRARGLMGVTDLEDLDGMLFVLDAPAVTRFWMKDTLIPLDIAFFDDEGGFVAAFTMEPCPSDPCPSYGPDTPVRYALEVPAGTMPPVRPGSVLDRGG